MFDFDAAIADAEIMVSRRELEAIILAPSGGGKSALAGTFGVKTLHIFSSGENHGPLSSRENARRAGVDSALVVPFCMDLVTDGDTKKTRRLEPKEVYDRLIAVLQSGKELKEKGFGAVFIDGAAELEIFIREHPEWKKGCLTASGKHDGWAESKVTATMFRPFINALKDLQREQAMHFAVTCMLDVKEVGRLGEIMEAAPRLKGYTVCEQLIQQFGDVLVVGRMTNPKTDKSDYRLQFMTDIAKATKDEQGTQKRAMNFSPRISGATPPPHMEADLRKVIALKAGVNAQG